MTERSRRVPTSRHNVSTACKECRNSKSRCDGNVPRCQRCVIRGKECVYSLESDKRRGRVRLKKAALVFLARIQQLEAFITRHGLDVPQIPEENREVFNNLVSDPKFADAQPQSIPASGSNSTRNESTVVDSSGQLTALSSSDLGISNSHEQFNEGETTQLAEHDQQTDGLQAQVILGAAGETLYQNEDLLVAKLISDSSYQSNCATNESVQYGDFSYFPVGFRSQEISGNAACTERNHPSASEGDYSAGDDEELVNQLSNRMGDLHLMVDGQRRFYGATSNFNFVKPDVFCEQLNITSASDGFIQEPSQAECLGPELITHLENLYFSWQDPCFHVVDRGIYEDSKILWKTNQGRSTFYSPFLMNAICAFGALLYRPRSKSMEISQNCLQSAKALLEIELDSPKVATVQGLVILSSFEAATTRDARGWLYSGMAMRLAFDLGLHVDMSPYISRGEMAVAESRARCIAFWGCYVVDHLWGVYLGRPFHINGGNITVQKPTGKHDGSSPSIWISTELDESTPEKGPTASEPSDFGDLLLPQWVSLCEITDALGNVMYGCNSVSKGDLIQVARKTMDDLAQWKLNLPPHLEININNTSTCPSPHLIVLHMEYYHILLYAHRPLISEDRTSTWSQHQNLPQQSRTACLESASAISKLVRVYEENFTLQHINIQAVSIIFSAALFLVFAHITPSHCHDQRAIATDLETCSQSLAKIGAYFENASRSLDLLLSIKREWKARLVASGHSWQKRSSSYSFQSPHDQLSQQYQPPATQLPATQSCSNANTLGPADPLDIISFNLSPFDSADWRYAVAEYSGDTVQSQHHPPVTDPLLMGPDY